jgi:hypothetical protein
MIEFGGLREMVVSDEWCNWRGSKTQRANEIASIVLKEAFG